MARKTAIKVLTPTKTIEGAGVHLNRVFGFEDIPQFDPFLLFDDFSSENPDDYIKGFPWHPHRGIETITYLIKGDFQHGDSMGNRGYISSGDLQWMTAGSGVIHEEKPRGSREGGIVGFQLWANLPALHKMMSPRYQEIPSDTIPVIELPDRNVIRVIAGDFRGTEGPISDIMTNPQYFDIHMQPNTDISIAVSDKQNCFVYLFEGELICETDKELQENSSSDVFLVRSKNCILFGDGKDIYLKTGSQTARFLCISGDPIKEPIAWRGPIVMNTDEELTTAFKEYNEGTFLKV